MNVYNKNVRWLLLVFLATSFSLYAQAPQLINYQGKLIKDGKPITGMLDITFAIYADSIGETSLWSETQNSVSLMNGMFNVLLGSVLDFPVDLFNENAINAGSA